MRKMLVPVACLAVLLAAPAAGQTPVVELDTVEVSVASRASRASAATRAVQTITGDELRRLPAANVAEAIGRAIGVDLMPRSAALADVAIRGSSFEQVLVMVDGVRVSDAQTGHFSLNLTVPLDQVERVEVLRGAGSAVHGADAVGGAINIVTRGSDGSSARAESGSFATHSLAVRHARSGGAVDFDLGADFRTSEGHRPGTDYSVATVRGSAGTVLGGHRLSADVGYAARDFGANGFYGPYDSYEETRTTTAVLGWEAPPAAASAVGARLSARRNGDDFVLVREDPALYRNRHATSQLGGELTLRHAVSPRLRLAGVVEAYEDRLESASLGDRSESRSAAGAELVAGTPGAAVGAAGVRADWHEAHGFVASPSLSVAWWPASPVRLRGALSRSFRTPSWTDRFYSDPANVGNPDLAPERAWTAEAGVHLELYGAATLDATTFVREAEDLIDWAKPAMDEAAPWMTRNVETARFRGIELEAGLARVLGIRWTARAALLSVASSAEEGYVSKYALRPLTETIAVTAERSVLPGLTLGAEARRSRRTGEEAYLLLDGRLAWVVGRRARLFLDVRNLTDEGYDDVAGMPAPGRSLSAGVSWGSRR